MCPLLAFYVIALLRFVQSPIGASSASSSLLSDGRVERGGGGEGIKKVEEEAEGDSSKLKMNELGEEAGEGLVEKQQ